MKIYYGILAVLLVMAGCAKPETPNGFIDADIFLNPPIEYRSARSILLMTSWIPPK